MDLHCGRKEKVELYGKVSLTHTRIKATEDLEQG